jgi:hypothetical protein
VSLDESRLRELAEAFYGRVCAAWQACPMPRPTLRDQAFWTAQHLEFARQVSAAAHETDARALRRIHQITSGQYEYLSPNDRMLGIGRVMREVADTALAALRAGGKE